jgi:hypothetical protein
MSAIRPFAILLLFGILPIGAQAQRSMRDYIVTTAHDTLRGRIQLAGKQHGKIRLYRRDGGFSVFGPAQIASYGTANGVIEVSRQVSRNEPARLLMPLVTGYISLYKGKNDHHETVYYLQAPDSTHVTEVARASSQLTLARMLAGCPTLEFGLDETQSRYPYSTDGMIRLLTAYNSCRQPGQPTLLVKRAGGWRTSVGLKAGVNRAYFNILTPSYGGLGEHKNAAGYQAGITFNLAGLGHFSTQVEATYLAQRSSYGPYERYYSLIGTPGNTHLVTVRLSELQLPVLVRYEAGYGRWRPYLNAGPNVTLNLGNSSGAISPNSRAGNQEPVEFGKASLGLSAGSGIALHSPSLPTISLEVRYDRAFQSPAHNEYLYHVSHHNSLRFEVGAAF